MKNKELLLDRDPKKSQCVSFSRTPHCAKAGATRMCSRFAHWIKAAARFAAARGRSWPAPGVNQDGERMDANVLEMMSVHQCSDRHRQ